MESQVLRTHAYIRHNTKTHHKNTQQKKHHTTKHTSKSAVHMVFCQHKPHQQGIQRNSLLVGPGVAHGVRVAVDIQPGHAYRIQEQKQK